MSNKPLDIEALERRIATLEFDLKTSNECLMLIRANAKSLFGVSPGFADDIPMACMAVAVQRTAHLEGAKEALLNEAELTTPPPARPSSPARVV